MAKQLLNTEAGLRALHEELDFLKNTKREEVKKNLALARSFGDLSENSEYDEARNEQAKVEARINELEQIILHTTVVDEDALDHSTVHLGSTVVVRDETTGKEKQYKIVGSNESKPEDGKISDRSPIGSAILGKTEGAEVVVVTPKGERRMTILEVKRTVKD